MPTVLGWIVHLLMLLEEVVVLNPPLFTNVSRKLYIHPNCKYDANCTRMDCPFTHATRRGGGFKPTIIHQCKLVCNDVFGQIFWLNMGLNMAFNLKKQGSKRILA